MASLIFLAGYRGCGKTTILKQYTDQALCIVGDALQEDAARRAFPFIRRPHLYSWKSWPQDPTTMHLELLMFTSLNSVSPNVREHVGPIFIEGAVLAKEWFRNAFTSALGANGKIFSDEDVHLLYLRPSPERVFENIQKRLQNSAGREDERRKLRTLEDVETRLCSYAKAISGSKWKHFADSDAVHTELARILGGATTTS